MHYLYIIYSSSLDRYYVGETHDLESRMEKHREQGYRGSYTRSASDWAIKLSRNCSNREEAMYLEGFIKRMKSRKFIAKVIADPLILEDIWSKR